MSLRQIADVHSQPIEYHGLHDAKCEQYPGTRHRSEPVTEPPQTQKDWHAEEVLVTADDFGCQCLQSPQVSIFQPFRCVDRKNCRRQWMTDCRRLAMLGSRWQTGWKRNGLSMATIGWT